MAVSCHDHPGAFVTFEGGDGVGKTTQIQRILSWLVSRGIPAVATIEPGGTPLGVRIRELLLHGDDMSPRAEALLYAADRAHHVATVVSPALARGEVVLGDRYIDSSVAYQGAGRELAEEQIRRLSEWATEGLQPDLTILLDAPAELAQKRVREGESGPDRLESEQSSFHERVRQKYLALAEREPRRWAIIDASDTLDVVEAQIRRAILRLLNHPSESGSECHDGGGTDDRR